MPKMPKQKSAYYKPQETLGTEEPRLKVNPRTIKVKKIYPKNERQEHLLESILDNDLTFVRGVAGTGKTFLVIYAALQALANGEVDRIIISRPAVDAGESIGFIPGSISEKMDPYLQPIIQAFKQVVGPNIYQALRENEYIQILPFAYMRGMSIANSFVILDECQNATADQMKTALTRIGEGSVCVVTFDPDQIDLVDKAKSSVHDMGRFESVKGIGFISFRPEDVLRSKLVRLVLDCYRDELA